VPKGLSPLFGPVRLARDKWADLLLKEETFGRHSKYWGDRRGDSGPDFDGNAPRRRDSMEDIGIQLPRRAERQHHRLGRGTGIGPARHDHIFVYRP